MDSYKDIFKDKTIAEFVTDDFRSAEIFKQAGIDFCCGGKRTVSEACEKKGIDLDEFRLSMEKHLDSTNQNIEQDYASWDTEVLANHILQVHHEYIRKNLPLLDEFSKKVARVHGESSPELIELRGLFLSIATELSQHIQKEEMILFPRIIELAQFAKSGNSESSGIPPFVSGPIQVMESEHDSAGDIIHQMKSITNNFTPPDWACNTYRVLFFKLNEFTDDLFLHIHLENNILFPKAIELEKKLLVV